MRSKILGILAGCLSPAGVVVVEAVPTAQAADFTLKFGLVTRGDMQNVYADKREGSAGGQVQGPHRGQGVPGQSARHPAGSDRRHAARHDRGLHGAGRLLCRCRQPVRGVQHSIAVQEPRARQRHGCRSRAQQGDPRPRRSKGPVRRDGRRCCGRQVFRQEADHQARRLQGHEVARQRHARRARAP